MAERPGWFGLSAQLLHFLRTVGADRAEDGKFLIGGLVVTGLGGEDVVLDAEAVYFVGGQPHGLASGLAGTSYGMSVMVI